VKAEERSRGGEEEEEEGAGEDYRRYKEYMERKRASYEAIEKKHQQAGGQGGGR
jgi:hypothetical protein